MHHFLINITIALSLFFQQQIDVAALKKDPIIIQYKYIMDDIREGQISRKYVLPNDPQVMKSFGSNPTKENLKKLLNDKGMKNANEYVDKMFLQTKLMFDFLKKHPELSKLDANKRQQIIRQLLYE
jgi:hypothetical protein